MGNYLFTSESVSEGHPDKICDQISDTILDEALIQDPESRVACETLTTRGLVFVAGEITTKGYIDIPLIARKVVRDIGYNDPAFGFHYDSNAVITAIQEQSCDIAMGVDKGGAGDQGMMFGYATDETPELMPMPIIIAHKLVRKMADMRKSGVLKYLRPDAKSQVTVLYEDGYPKSIESVVLSAQHDPAVEQARIKKDLIEHVVNSIVPREMMSDTMKIFVNPTGCFSVGGPQADTGVTGRKIIVDTYGGVGSHGGGCFSGKDPSKVDRSASYMARYIAKNVVASGMAKKCEIQLAYVIGESQPVSIMLNTEGTSKITEEEIITAIRDNLDLSPNGIIEKLDLKKPIYARTAAYGHFGREEKEGFTWEKKDMADVFKKYI